LCSNPGQALTYFQWMNLALSECPHGKKPLILNLDETAVAYAYASQKGMIVSKTRLPEGTCKASETISSRADIRGNVTFIAIICDDPLIQPRLPQFILGNEHKFTHRLLASVAGQISGNFIISRQKSAWNCHVTMRTVLSQIRDKLADLTDSRYIILTLDMASCHIHDTIYQHARRCNIRLVYIPAKLTFLLQPCDTHLFIKLKRKLRELWVKARYRHAKGQVEDKDWLLLVCAAAKQVLNGTKWSHAFQATGALNGQGSLSSSIKMFLEWSETPVVLHGAPSVEDVQFCFPKGRLINLEKYIRWTPATPSEEVANPATAPACVLSEVPISSRTRNRILNPQPLSELATAFPTRNQVDNPPRPTKNLPWTLRPQRPQRQRL
jgi:hypothetical protein